MRLRLLIALSWLLPLMAAPLHADAQDKHRHPPAAKHPAKPHGAKPSTKHKPAPAAPASDTSSATPAHAETTATSAGHEEAAPVSKSAAPAADAEENVRKEGGNEVKTMEFGGLDIEGQLKTPQMLYFLNRLRAEFDRPQLPHRSFMPELQRSTKEDVF